MAAEASSGPLLALADLVAQSVMKFSSRSGSADTGSTTSSATKAIPPTVEQSWRAARMRDMFRAQQQQQRQRKKRQYQSHMSSCQRGVSLGPNGLSKGSSSDSFQDLFGVSDREMRERETEQTLEIMAENLRSLQDEVAESMLTETAWNSLVCHSTRGS